jgi:hypothetical protein
MFTETIISKEKLQIIVVLSRRIEGHASFKNLAGLMQFKKVMKIITSAMILDCC